MRSGAGVDDRAVRTVCFARGGRLPGQTALGDALWFWRSPRENRHKEIMNTTRSDALVFFGATGDLAYKKIFPPLQAMVKRGNLNVPVIGVARSAPDLKGLIVIAFGFNVTSPVE